MVAEAELRRKRAPQRSGEAGRVGLTQNAKQGLSIQFD
jgi:hypothetical protein